MKVGRKGKSATENKVSRIAKLGLTEETANVSSEEDVFARLVSDEVTRTQSTETVAAFKALIDKQVAIRTRADGSVNWEKVAKGALKWASSEKQNLIKREDAEQIYSRSFSAAQIDSNSDSLDNSSVSSAVENTDKAFEQARIKLEKYASGAVATPTRSLLEKATSSLTSSYRDTKTSEQNLKDIILSNIDFQI